MSESVKRSPYRGLDSPAVSLYDDDRVLCDLSVLGVTIYRHMDRATAETFCRDLAAILGLFVADQAQDDAGEVALDKALGEAFASGTPPIVSQEPLL